MTNHGEFLVVLFKALAAGLAVIYVSLVLMAFRTDGQNYRVHWNWNDIARSAEHLAIWGGVQGIVGANRVVQSVLEVLTEASAEVGEWFLRTARADGEAKFRSRFL